MIFRTLAVVFATLILCDSVYSFSVLSVTTVSSVPKKSLLDSLDVLDELNDATPTRTALVKALCEVNPTPNPGSVASFTDLAVGEWRVVYAPHMSFMGNLVRGRFAPVIYDMRSDGTITSMPA
jgi:hypothetical protein